MKGNDRQCNQAEQESFLAKMLQPASCTGDHNMMQYDAFLAYCVYWCQVSLRHCHCKYTEAVAHGCNCILQLQYAVSKLRHEHAASAASMHGTRSVQDCSLACKIAL